MPLAEVCGAQREYGRGHEHMTTPDTGFADFQRLVLTDTALFDQLAAVYAPDAFVALAVRLGAERNLVFTADDVRSALQTARRAWIERHLP